MRIQRARRAPRLALVAMLAGLLAGQLGAQGPAAGAATEVPRPTLSVPPAGLRGHALWDSYYDLAPFGYEEQELFVSGTAVDGVGATAPFTTRMIVTRPSDPADFNGTVLLDWVNVTAQFENAVDTMLAREMLMREGFAYVHVSAQAAGLCCFPPFTPQTWDPVRYAAIDHPGDGWSFDIFTQIAQAFEVPAPPGDIDPMGGTGVGAVRQVIAAGQSQSGIQLHDYIQTWLPSHPEAVGVIDGFLVHGDVGKPKSYGQPPPVPVLHLLSDFEAVDDGFDPAALSPNERLWEVAGSSHADLFIGYQSVFGHGPRVMADAAPVSAGAYQQIIEASGNYGERVDPLLAGCIVAGAALPMHYATSTAIHELASWVGGGAPPASGPRFEFADDGSLATDEFGNTRGGIRLPPIDVPVARYESTACALGGITVPFLDSQIQQLYPTHAEYYGRMADRADAAVAAGWLLPEDAADLLRRACAAAGRWPAGQAPCAPYAPPAFRTPLPVDTDAPTDAAIDPAATSRPSPAGAAGSLPATGREPGASALGGATLLALAVLGRGLHRRPRADVITRASGRGA